MKKEVLIAIITGFALGLLITFGVWTANRALKESAPQKESSIEIKETPIPSPRKQELSLTVLSPEDNSISDQEEIEVSGKAIPEAVIVILYQDGEKILEADKEGNFKTTITLVGGSNEIKISTYDSEGNEVSKTLTVVYSTVKI